MSTTQEYMVESLNDHMGYYFCSSKLLHKEQTKYQLLEIHEIPKYGRALRLDGILQTSDKDEFLYHEILIHVPAILINGPKRALLIGGGDGGGIEELLKYPTLEKVTMVELDQAVIQRSEEYLPKISNGAFASDKLELFIQDGLEYIKNTKERFDQVILDLTDAFGPSLSLYTQEFYRQIKKIMSPKGILSLHIESPITVSENFKRIYWTLKSIFKSVCPMLNYVPLYGSLWGFATASDYYSPSKISQREVYERLIAHQIKDLKFYNEETHQSIQLIPPYIKELIKKPALVITEENKNSIQKIKQKKMQLTEI